MQDLGMSTASSGEDAQVHDDELRVVVGVDGSEYGRRALEFAAHEAAWRGALLEIVSAYQETPYVMAWPVVPLGPDQMTAAAIVDESLARAEEIEPRIVSKGEIRYGAAGKVLVEASEAATLLVVGSHGRGQIASLFLGSVSEHCAHHAASPITIVR
jgi:nucleotide-binding universal stress UspA family protein